MRTTGHEHLSGCLVVPLSDAEGRVVQLYGRRLERDKLNTRHLYLPGSHRGVFNHAGLAGVREVILCEALIDALTFWCAGYRAVTSGYGVEGVTEEVLDAIATAGAELVQIAFDRDEAGDRGAEKVAERLAERGIGSARVEFPKGMDANAYAQKVGPATQSLGLVLRQAKPMRSGAPARAVTQTPSSPSAAPFPSLAASLAPSSELPAPESAPPVALTPTPAPTAERPSLPSLRVERHGEDVFFSFGGRKWRARSAGKPSATELKLNLVVADEREGGPFFVDSLDLYSARHRGNYLKAAAAELGADEAELRRGTAEILQQLERERPTRSAEATTAQGATMSEADRAEALELLCDPKLCERIVEDLGRAGIVGEETNKLISYIAATSRKLEEPLAVVIQSSSAAGKSSLMEAVLGLMPEEERVQYSAMTGQSLFYMSGQTLKHKILAIVEEEGAERASYALKLLQSEGELTMASTGKDPATGRLITQTYRVEGPVMILLTTTSPDVDEELLNRCLVLSVDERRGQTRAIHERQRAAQTLEGCSCAKIGSRCGGCTRTHSACSSR
ncbi:MAG: toprim domain-containing protein [Polyangiaceae bacterium]|nr:toprim domain-containing protein [Polyangiaceae bacterium]